jgi:exodeoxyribonuclease V alpha subunit
VDNDRRDLRGALADIRAGSVPKAVHGDGSLVLAPWDASKTLEEQLDHLLHGLRPTCPLQEDLLVITPTNRKRMGLAPIVRDALRTSPREPPHVSKNRVYDFAEGDRVMQCVNRYDVKPERYNANVGTVTRIDVQRGLLWVRWDDQAEDDQLSTYGLDEALEELSAADAITVHKAQGSQAPFVVFAADDSVAGMSILDRRLIYTAASRARQRLFLLCPPCVLKAAVANKGSLRCTNMAHLCVEGVDVGQQDIVHVAAVPLPLPSNNPFAAFSCGGGH